MTSHDAAEPMPSESPVVDALLRHALLGPPLRVASFLRVRGQQNVPATGGAILASNHLSFCDSLFLPLAAGRAVAMLGKDEYFTGTGLRGYLVKSFMRATGTIPVDRSNARVAMAAIDTSVRAIEEGRLFGIYPEGTRSPDGRLHRGRAGAAHVILRTGVPVIPCALTGTQNFQPPGSVVMRPARVRVVFGEPIDYGGAWAEEPKGARVKLITEDLMKQIQALSGQEYVHTYAVSPDHRD